MENAARHAGHSGPRVVVPRTARRTVDAMRHTLSTKLRWAFACCACATLTGCYQGLTADAPDDAPHDDQDTNADGGSDGGDDDMGAAAQTPALRRLTRQQYVHAIDAAFGAGISVPGELGVDSTVAGLVSPAMGVVTLSALEVGRYESSAYKIAQQIVTDPDRRAEVFGCQPSGVDDETCLAGAVENVGRRLWRRDLGVDEVDRITGLGLEVAAEADDFWSGAEFSVAALLVSPHFLYRVELWEEVDGQLRFDDWAMATRLSFLITDGPPPSALLEMAGEGMLTTEEGISDAVDLLLASEAGRRGMVRFFEEQLGVWDVESVAKDAAAFPEFDDALATSMQASITRTVDAIVFDNNGDYTELLTSPIAWLDADLAQAAYGIELDADDEMVAVETDRAGVLMHPAFLSQQAGEIVTSPTRRGRFVWEMILCGEMEGPPPEANAEFDSDASAEPTARGRLERHASDPACRGCHFLIDPIGLGLENYDAIGAFREMENGAPIDASGELAGGAAFEDAVGLSQALAEHPQTHQCLVETYLRYANGRAVNKTELEVLESVSESFEDDAQGRLSSLMKLIATDAIFRQPLVR